MLRKYKVELTRDPAVTRRLWQERPPAPMSPDSYNFPSVHFNGTIAPLAPYAIRGAAWYQGESNAVRAHEYGRLLPALIRGWRRAWGGREFPFLIVQLSTVNRMSKVLGESNWAELREAQRMALREPNTALVVTTDLGDGSLHPQDKAGVARRMALAACRTGCGMKDVVSSGPLYKTCRTDGARMVLRFDHVEGGLVAKGETELGGFIVAGADKKFVEAKAKIDGDEVMVWSDEIREPKAVRYAWSHNPKEANLYNREGLPACPFRTDAWPGTTDGVMWPDTEKKTSR